MPKKVVLSSRISLAFFSSVAVSLPNRFSCINISHRFSVTINL